MAGVTRGPRPKFKKGEKVYYLESRPNPNLPDHISVGVIHHYNPATEQSYVITKGRPVYTIKACDGHRTNVFADYAVAAFTPAGRAYLHDLACWEYMQGKLFKVIKLMEQLDQILLAIDEPVIRGGFGRHDKYQPVFREKLRGKEKAQDKACQKETHHPKQTKAPATARGGGRRGRENVDRPPGSGPAARVRKAHGRRGQG